MNVASLFTHRSNSTALVCVQGTQAAETRTHRQLLTDVVRISAGLRTLGVKEGNRVLVMTGGTLHTLETILGIFNLGATAVPVNGQLAKDSLQGIIRQLEPACCIAGKNLSADLRATLEARCPLLVMLNDSATQPDGWWQPYGSLLAEAQAPLGLAEGERDRPALIMHTSASLGRPKAIEFSHERLAVFFRYFDFFYSQLSHGDESDRPTSPIVSVLPLTYLGGLAVCMLGLMTQRPTYFMPHFIPGQFLALVEMTKCDAVMLVPSMYRTLLTDPSLRGTDLSALKFCVTLGEPCSPQLAEAVTKGFGATVLSAYGLSECVSGIGHPKADLLAARVKSGSCGKHLFGEVKLTDDGGAERADFGELWVRNPTVFPCYLDSALNEERLQAGWFRTRDLFRRDRDGNFFHCGRCDEMFFCNGKNVYPAEIESALMAHPAVEAVCAVPIRTHDNRTAPAVAILRRGAVEEEDILEFSKRSGLGHAAPQLVHFVDRFPKAGAEKWDRREAVKLLQYMYDMRRRATPGRSCSR